MKKRIYITRRLPEEAVEPLRDQYDVRMWKHEGESVPREVLLEEASSAHALWTMLSDTIDREVFERATHLEVVSNLAVGYNNIDLNAAKENGVIVTNTPDVLTETTADLTFGLMMMTARRLGEAERDLRAGEWKSWLPMGYVGMDLYQAKLGIIGMGRIGEAVARRARGFDMEVLYHNRTRRHESESMYGFTYAELDELLTQSDFVVVLAPLTDETRGMLGAKEFAKMKETSIFINVARGEIIDEQALYEALKARKIWGAGLDVFTKEPIDLGHPLLTLPNVTTLPHIGSATIRTRLAMMALNRDAITNVLEGKEPKNRLT
ncbi:2-hydroxyacid dehydrogenase [Exiguobacterium profundum]|uniref:2-hydroxyacid dehydrogenase n=1 Tax=Exiguobacterium TaxID=33986 RepID=UPI001BE7B2D6|nr:MULTISPECIES: D-glycerate dehydrogenase [Exiguobacterium]MCT4797531.1 D-glycerate dehydrogenase [Exiguobacterium profundum]MDT0192970.1 D-glycerate dehydrogenase [Exiguobacterium sp. BG5(2022)]